MVRSGKSSPDNSLLKKGDFFPHKTTQNILWHASSYDDRLSITPDLKKKKKTCTLQTSCSCRWGWNLPKMTVALLLPSSYEPPGTLLVLHPITSDTIKETKDSGTVSCENKGALCVPVIRMFFRMCLGVSPSSKDIRAAVLDSLWTLLVGGNGFVVMLLEESTQFNSKFGIYVTGICLHLTSRIFCRMFRLSMSCGVWRTLSLLLSLLLRLVTLRLCALVTLKTGKARHQEGLGVKERLLFLYVKGTRVSVVMSPHRIPNVSVEEWESSSRINILALNNYLRVIGVLGGSVLRICLSRTRADKSSVGSIWNRAHAVSWSTSNKLFSSRKTSPITHSCVDWQRFL